VAGQRKGGRLPAACRGASPTGTPLVVASEIDDSTERIIHYLSETYGVDINAVRFQFFQAEHTYPARFARLARAPRLGGSSESTSGLP
jgi:hypothetical protein